MKKKKPAGYWTAERITDAVLHTAFVFGRMPTNAELVSIGRADVAGAVVRSGGFKHWAKQLSLERKACRQIRGYQWEAREANHLRSIGFDVEETRHKSKHDLTVNGLRVELKTSTFHSYKENRQAGYWFNRLRNSGSVDFFILLCVADSAVKRRFCIPAEAAPATSIHISNRTLIGKTKYSRFENALDLLRSPARGESCGS